MHKEAFDIYIGRPSKWGNPFSSRDGTLAKYKVSTRGECITRYEEYIRETPELFNSLHELKDKVLGCHCKPKACHGDVLQRMVIKYTAEDIF
jgi:hypothetical protein